MCDIVSRSRNGLLTPSFKSFLHCLKESRKTMKAMIDKRNHHGAVDESLSEQQFVNLQ